MTQEEMNLLVPQKLDALEKQHDVRVLLAVESGSRAWGFASPDSDFDVRFIYVHRPAFYLRLENRRDVIEEPVDDTWDVSGWDLDKTLRLLFKSNPTLFEWLRSPIVDRETGFSQRIQPLTEEYFSVKSALYHYLNTARNDIRSFLQGETVRPKKYFYALRPILACRWALEQKSPPPVLFSRLVEAELPDSLGPAVEHLLDLKMNGPEKLEIPPIPEISRYLEASMEELSQVMAKLPEEKPRDWEMLNQFFLKELAL